eukprot:CFRG1081T1
MGVFQKRNSERLPLESSGVQSKEDENVEVAKVSAERSAVEDIPNLDMISHFIDSNVRIIRSAITTGGIVGIIVIIYSLGGHIKYMCAEDIPHREYERQSKFRGVVVETSMCYMKLPNSQFTHLVSIDLQCSKNGGLQGVFDKGETVKNVQDLSISSNEVLPLIIVEHRPLLWRLLNGLQRVLQLRKNSKKIPGKDGSRIAIVPIGIQSQDLTKTATWLVEKLLYRTVTVKLIGSASYAIASSSLSSHMSSTVDWDKAPTASVCAVRYKPPLYRMGFLRPQRNVSFDLLREGLCTAANTFPPATQSTREIAAVNNRFVAECIKHEVWAQKNRRGIWATPLPPGLLERIALSATEAQEMVRQALPNPSSFARIKSWIRFRR